MKLPPTKKILREDVKEAPSWISGIIEPVNSFMENVYQALNGNITFNQNINSFVKEITYRTTSAYPVAAQISFTNDLKVRATGVFVLQAFDRLNYQPAPGPVYVPWVEDSGSILINAITGLAADKVYTIRLLII